MTKTLLLTGATGDIGSAIHKKFAEQGYKVIAPTRKELDLESPAAIAEFTRTFHEPIDAFVHCAGFNDPKTVLNLTEQDVQKTFQINTFSFYTLCQYLLGGVLKKSGSIVAISSLYGELSRKGRCAYASSKHALNGMVKTLAIEMGAHNVRVNGVAPGFVDTQMTRKNNSPDVIEGMRKRIPLGRLAASEDIAEVTYFLCSDSNRYISGQCIVVDGGFSVGGFQE